MISNVIISWGSHTLKEQLVQTPCTLEIWCTLVVGKHSPTIWFVAGICQHKVYWGLYTLETIEHPLLEPALDYSHPWQCICPCVRALPTSWNSLKLSYSRNSEGSNCCIPSQQTMKLNPRYKHITHGMIARICEKWTHEIIKRAPIPENLTPEISHYTALHSIHGEVHVYSRKYYGRCTCTFTYSCWRCGSQRGGWRRR